jgi:hypothetical protein
MNVDTELSGDSQQQQHIQQSPNSKQKLNNSKKRKLDDLGLENISDSECPSKSANHSVPLLQSKVFFDNLLVLLFFSQTKN